MDEHAPAHCRGATSPSLGERIGRFVDRAWQHFGSARYRTTFEILLNLPPDLAATQMRSGRSVGCLETELGYLKDTLARELGHRGK